MGTIIGNIIHFLFYSKETASTNGLEELHYSPKQCLGSDAQIPFNDTLKSEENKNPLGSCSVKKRRCFLMIGSLWKSVGAVPLAQSDCRQFRGGDP